MKKLSALLLLTLASLLTHTATMRADVNNEASRYAGFEALPACQSEDVVFIGNSITHMMNWWEAFGNQHSIHARGNSGAKTYQALANLESMIAGQPAKAFIMLGTNDLGDADSPEHAASLVKTFCKRIRLESPATIVYCQSLLPSGVGARKGNVAKVNAILKQWVEQQKDEKLVYVDLFALLDDSTGSIRNRGNKGDFTLSYDDLHLTPIGYRIWMKEIEKYLGGMTTVIPANTKNLHGNQTTSWGARIATFSTLPVSKNDILMFSDDMIHYGEWHEMIGSTDFKDRGTGWQFFSSNLACVQASLEPALSKSQYNVKNCDVKRETPAAVCIHAGGRNIMDGQTGTTLQQNYKAVVDAARAQVDATTPIFLLSILPLDNSTKNNEVKALNAYMKTLADADAHIHYVDLYSALSTSDKQNATYFHANKPVTINGTKINPYPTPLGYVKVANILAENVDAVLGTNYKATTLSEEDARANMARFARRSLVGNAINDVYAKFYNMGDAIGQYSSKDAEKVEATIAEVATILQKLDITQEEAEAAVARLQAITFTMNLPLASKDGDEHWYTFCSSKRNSLYMVNNNGTVIGTADGGNNQNGQWKLIERTDGTFDIINRATMGYLQPASYNADITVSSKVPTLGWEFSECNSPAMFNVQNGTCELNMTNLDGTGGKRVVNWSAGNGAGGDRTDLGCQFTITEVEDVSLPEPEDQYTVDKDHGTLTSNGNAITWCNTWESNDKLLTFRASANNMQWDGTHIDARSGQKQTSDYTLSTPAGYHIVSYTFDATAITTTAQTWTTGGKTYNVTNAEATTIGENNLNAQSVSFTLTGGNTGTLLTNFIVVIAKDGTITHNQQVISTDITAAHNYFDLQGRPHTPQPRSRGLYIKDRTKILR